MTSQQPNDLSPGAIRRAVMSASLQHPSVVYPAAIGVLGGLGAVVMAASPVLLAAAATAGGAALIAVAVNYFFRHDRIAGKYVEALRSQMAQERATHIADLEADLKEVRSEEGSMQLTRFVEKIKTFHAILAEKLSPSELTFARFSAIAEAVFLAGVENLRAVQLSLKALHAIDQPYVRNRITALENKLGQAKPTNELTGLRGQLAQAEQLLARVRTRLGENELALAELDRATAAIGDMRTGTDRAALDMETAMAELARIAQRSREYS
jgi:hypothetical protein